MMSLIPDDDVAWVLCFMVVIDLFSRINTYKIRQQIKFPPKNTHDNRNKIVMGNRKISKTEYLEFAWW